MVRLQSMFLSKGYDKPQLLSCQHHVLDRILRVVMDDELAGASKSPNIEYFFVKELMASCEELQGSFQNGAHVIKDQAGWRDNMKFLFHLSRAFRFFHENRDMPFIKFQKILNICNDRWNSQAILALLASFFMAHMRERLQTVCQFILHDWVDHCFSDQTYRAEDYAEL